MLFSRLTGVRTIASNYPGTTVGYTAGSMRFGGGSYTVVDAPGTYSLEPLDEAARVAIDLIDAAERIINVVDATHLERHLPLTLELIAQGKPLVVALNMSDEARHLGIEIQVDALEELLGVPVVPTVARTGEGVVRLIETALSRDDPRRRRRATRAAIPRITRTCRITTPGSRRTGTSTSRRRRSGAAWARSSTRCRCCAIITTPSPSDSRTRACTPCSAGSSRSSCSRAAFSVVRLIGEFLVSGGVGIAGEPWFRRPLRHGAALRRGVEAAHDEALRRARRATDSSIISSSET